MAAKTDQPIILAFVGMTGSGKDTCTNYVAQKTGAPVIHFGNIIYAEVARRGLDIVKDEKAVREDMRAKGGPAVIAKHVAAQTKEYLAAGKNRIILNGLYSWSEYKYLHQEFGDQLVCVALASPRALRYKRIVERKDARRQYTIEQIIDREIAEIENLEKGGPIARADFTLTNNTIPDDLYRQLDQLLQEIKF